MRFGAYFYSERANPLSGEPDLPVEDSKDVNQ